jgi:hypothetical protein
MGLGLDWRLRIWSGRSNDAPVRRKKLTDDLKDRFKKQLDNARLDKRLEADRKELVDARQADLWNNLRDVARNRVKEINDPDPMLVYTDVDTVEFSVVYDCDGEKRKAIAKFRQHTHVVEVTIERANNNIAPKRYVICAKNNKINFELNELLQIPQEIMEEMLSNVL